MMEGKDQLNRTYEYKDNFCVFFPTIRHLLDMHSRLRRICSQHVVYKIFPRYGRRNSNKTGMSGQRIRDGFIKRLQERGVVSHNW